MVTQRRVPRLLAVTPFAVAAAAALRAYLVANSGSLGGSGDSLRDVLPEDPTTLEACESPLASTECFAMPLANG
ncbi:hypothetical protein [Saccharopolyspora phatthalungensis]|uniref:Uncharacterized protein n=1 Tax=Saccharopolyspora phatthalungensis TaxID=664693 RepID=A0A840QD64_9PSEU|nr:hypothetical protein [Saccharopolyspora phatthalungensis]MBB5156395.1 hypothetical protein [Saccharopolyspora phatthalungensis]